MVARISLKRSITAACMALGVMLAGAKSEAAIINIGSFSFDDSTFATSAIVETVNSGAGSRGQIGDKNASVQRFTGETVEALIGSDLSTFATLGTFTSVQISFANALVNGVGDDILIFTDLRNGVQTLLPSLADGTTILPGDIDETVAANDSDNPFLVHVSAFDLTDFGLAPGAVFSGDLFLGITNLNPFLSGANISGIAAINQDIDNGNTVSVAEPTTLALFAMGLAGLGAARRRAA